MSRRFQHDWGFMANPGSKPVEGDLAQCQVATCRMWRFGDGKPFRMTYEQYVEMHERGEINASEVLGPRKTV